ncbi:MAG: hypothetical protein JWM34_45 [Ilumatobacteraceae bacterium]|nr:hypothetical protein [Ilumatobacteraceae bacterium]
MASDRPSRADDRLSVLVCRGCCCGTVAKHPDVDHAGHESRLRAAVGGVRGAKVFTVDCLDQCSRSNVVVVRARGERQWFGDMLDDSSVDHLADWLAGGGLSPMPDALVAHAFEPDELIVPPMAMDPRDGAALVAWVGDLLRAGGGWLLRDGGDEREFPAAGSTVHVDGRVITAATAAGSLQLTIHDDSRAFRVDRPDEPGTPVVIVLAEIGVAAGEAALPLGLEIPRGFVVRAVHFPSIEP